MSDEQREDAADTPNPPKKENRVVWMRCRASDKCEGTHAEVEKVVPGGLKVTAMDPTADKPREYQMNIAGGGHTSRYKCTTCGGRWVIQV